MYLKKKLKKALSCSLVVALVAAGIYIAPGTGVRAEEQQEGTGNEEVTETEPSTSLDVSKLKDCIAYFTFDDAESGFTYTVGEGENAKTVKATVNGSKIEAVADAASGQAVYMPEGNDSYYSVAYSDGSSLVTGYDELTISYWSKALWSDAEYYGWVYFCKDKDEDDDQRKYIGAVDKFNGLTVERGVPPTETPAPEEKEKYSSQQIKVEGDDIKDFVGTWKFVTVTYDRESTKIYINGELKSEEENTTPLSSYLKGNNTVFSIGYSSWGSQWNPDAGEYYQGYIDEYAVMSSAYTADQVKALYQAYSFDASNAPKITPSPTPVPTPTPTPKPTKKPTPTPAPSASPSAAPSAGPSTQAPSATPSATPAVQKPAVGTTLTAAGASYKVSAEDAVTYQAPASKTIKSVVIPATVTVDGNVYKVTAIADNAFAKCKKLTKVTIGPNIVKIGKKSFAKCSKLKNVIVKSSVITSVGKGAFTGTAKKAVFTFPKAKFNNYKKKIFKGKGQNKKAKYKKK